MEDVGEVEEALRARMAATLEAATAVLQLVEEQTAAKAGGGGSGAAAADGDGAALASPTSGGASGGRGGGGGRAGTNSKDAQLAALNNLLKAENNRLRDQALLDATKIKQLQCSLAGASGGGWGRAGGRVRAEGCLAHPACHCVAPPHPACCVAAVKRVG